MWLLLFIGDEKKVLIIFYHKDRFIKNIVFGKIEHWKFITLVMAVYKQFLLYMYSKSLAKNYKTFMNSKHLT